MGTGSKILIVAALVSAVVLVMALKQDGGRASGGDTEQTDEGKVAVGSQPASTQPTSTQAGTTEERQVLPKLIDFGREKCIPCKMMVPVLEELKSEYSGRFEVEVINIQEDPATARRYNVRVIPTQVFLGPDGEELYRHEGFYSKEDIITKWRELGFDFSSDVTGEQKAGS